jgi:hypothetical protein
MAARAAATLAVLEAQIPNLLALERGQPSEVVSAGLRVLDNEQLWAWFAEMDSDARSRSTVVSDDTACAVCHAAARDGGDALLLSLRQEAGGSSAWRLVQLGALESSCEQGMPGADARGAAAELVAQAVTGDAVSLCPKRVRDAALRSTFRTALLACAFTLPVELAQGDPRRDERGAQHQRQQQARGALRCVLVGGLVAEHILIAIERCFLAHRADMAAAELLREELGSVPTRNSTAGRKSSSSRRRGSNAKQRKQREKERGKQAEPEPQRERRLSLSDPRSEAASAAAAREARAARIAKVESVSRKYCEGAKPIPAVVLGRLGADVTEMADALAAIHDKRRPWENSVVDMLRAEVDGVFASIGQSAGSSVIEVVGSVATQLCVPGSGVDVAVCLDCDSASPSVTSCSPHKPAPMKKKAGDTVAELAKRLGNVPWVDSVELDQSPGARVPVVNIVCANSAMRISVLFDVSGPGQKGRVLETTKLMAELVEEFPLLRPLTLVLKQLLVERGLNDPYSGGLSSFGLVLLIAFILQRRRSRNGSSEVSEELGHALEEFLRFFGDEFDPSSQGVSVQRGCFALSSALAAVDDGGGISSPARDPLIIEDPTNPTNNVGRTCFGVALLQRALLDALGSLRSATVPTGPGATSTLGRLFQCQHHNGVVDLIRRTWCPADPHPVLPLEAEPVAADSIAVSGTLREELVAVTADRDTWEARAKAAERTVAELTARLKLLEEHETVACP